MAPVPGFPDDLISLCRHVEREIICYLVAQHRFTPCTAAEWLVAVASCGALLGTALGLITPNKTFLAEQGKSILFLTLVTGCAVFAWLVVLFRIERWSFRGCKTSRPPRSDRMSLFFRFDRVPQYATEFRVRFRMIVSGRAPRETVWTSDITRFFSNEGKFLQECFDMELEQATSSFLSKSSNGTEPECTR
jgi:hypothetical protein